MTVETSIPRNEMNKHANTRTKKKLGGNASSVLGLDTMLQTRAVEVTPAVRAGHWYQNIFL